MTVSVLVFGCESKIVVGDGSGTSGFGTLNSVAVVAATVTTAAFEQMKGEYADQLETFFPTTMTATVEEQEEKEQVA